MPIDRRSLVLAVALACSIVGDSAGAATQAPVIGKPRPAPSTPPDVAPLTPAVIDDTLAIAGDDLKARKVSTRLTVAVNVNGRGPYRFVVDSGADTSVVGLRIARDLELPLGTPTVLNGMTARNIVDRVRVDRLTIGPTTIRNLQLPALREEDLGGDGLLGIDSLVQQRLMMDFETRTVKVEDARVPVKSLPGEIVVVAYRKRGQLILTQVRAAGLPLDAVIDTGSEITIGNLALRDRLVRKRRDKLVTVTAVGVTGVEVVLQLAILGELRLGSVVLRNVPIAFADLPPFEAFGLAKDPAMLLGTDMLDTFRRISLDFRARKVRFQLRRCGSNRITVSSSPSIFARLSSTDAEVCRR